VQLKDKDAPRASRLATEIFREYQSQVKTLGEELDKAIAKDAGDASIKAAESALNAVRTKLSALGLDYINNSPKPQLAVLVNTMLAFEQLRDWKKVDEIAVKTLALYEADTTEQTKRVVDLVVRPKIGEALLQQRKFQQAYDMLVAAEKANPTQWEIKRQIARALGGWFEFSITGQPQKEPGLDRPAEAYLKHFTEYRTWAERSEVKPFSLEWYRFQWECYWFAKQASVKDGKYKDTAEKFYKRAKSTDDFATLKNLGAEGLQLFKYFQSNR
jgi:tetratricopeptide (TPR) repeat protein